SRSPEPPAVVLASLFVNMVDGSVVRAGSDDTWTVSGDVAGVEDKAKAIGPYWTAPWGPPVQTAANRLTIPGMPARSALDWFIPLAGTTAVLILMWLCVGRLVRSEAVTLEAALNRDAILHLPVLLVMAASLLLSYDVRVAPDWCFCATFVEILVLALLAG